MLKSGLYDPFLVPVLNHIEVTSFVSPKWIPQLADAVLVLNSTHDLEGEFSALVPNSRGLNTARDAKAKRIALFTAASDTFCLKNINMSTKDSLLTFKAVIDEFLAVSPKDKFVRAYISTVFECPYEGRIRPGAVVELAKQLFELGVDEISLGDTIGTAGPSEVGTLAEIFAETFDTTRLAFHFHDTNGTAIANVAEALTYGIRIFDSSAGGLGGCPYAPGAAGNLATEDLVYFLHREKWETGVDLDRLASASLEVLKVLGRAPAAKAQVAALARASVDSCAT